MSKNRLQQLSISGALKSFNLPSRSVIVRWINRSLEREANLAIRFVDTEEGRELNRSYRKKDYATNVLTFDYCHEPVVEADIVICVPVVVQQAKEQSKTFKEHLAHMVVHAVLHAQGYDHIEEEDAKVMEQLETDILTGLGFKVPYPDRDYKQNPRLKDLP